MLPCFKATNIKIKTKGIKLFPSTLPAHQEKAEGHSEGFFKWAVLKEEKSSLASWSGINRQRKYKNTTHN